jgi:inner membrane protein
MDLLTQGLLGAAVAQSGAPRSEARVATAVGLAAGLLPDADTLITSAADPLMFLDYHRHFTHALISVPAIALLAAVILWPFMRKRLSFFRVWFYALLGCLFAGTLDACTSYGTHLLWPFSDKAIAWSVVSIVDPVVTLALITGVVIGLRSMRRRPSAIALAVVVAYLSVGAVQHQRAQHAAEQLALSRGHAPERALVKPTLANVLLWRSLYTVDGRIYADAVQVSPFGGVTLYPGESAQLVGGVLQTDDPAASLAPVMQRFSRFATDLVVRHPERPAMLGDARFSMLPNRLKPLWGIEPAAEDAGYPAEFVTDRRLSDDERGQLVDMLLGRPTK